jgi:hypothetical protein
MKALALALASKEFGGHMLSSFLGNINGIQLAKFGLSIDRALSIQ